MLQQRGRRAQSAVGELRWRPWVVVAQRGRRAVSPGVPRGGVALRLVTLWCLAAGCLLCCSDLGCVSPLAAAREVEPPPQGEKPVPPPSVHLSYQGHWSYRFGDSPRTAGGTFLWAQPLPRSVPSGDGWLSAGPFRRFPGRAGHKFLWMRTRLHGPPLHEGILYMPGVDNLLEAYLDGQLIYRYGDMTGAPPYRFIGFRTHPIPIGTDYDGKTLSLRIYSDLRNLGPFGEPRLGERSEITADLFIEDLGRLVSSMLLILLGVTVLGLYLLRREERSYLMYGRPFA